MVNGGYFYSFPLEQKKEYPRGRCDKVTCWAPPEWQWCINIWGQKLREGWVKGITEWGDPLTETRQRADRESESIGALVVGVSIPPNSEVHHIILHLPVRVPTATLLQQWMDICESCKCNLGQKTGYLKFSVGPRLMTPWPRHFIVACTVAEGSEGQTPTINDNFIYYRHLRLCFIESAFTHLSQWVLRRSRGVNAES